MINSVVENINKIILDIPQIDSIIYTINVSSNYFIISTIKEELNEKGDLIFGLNSYIIRKRISKYIIGLIYDEDWNENNHRAHPEKNSFEKKIIQYVLVYLVQ